MARVDRWIRQRGRNAGVEVLVAEEQRPRWLLSGDEDSVSRPLHRPAAAYSPSVAHSVPSASHAAFSRKRTPTVKVSRAGSAMFSCVDVFV